MKKIVLLFILAFSIFGCSSMEIGSSKVVDNKNYTKITDSDVFYIEDLITLDKYYTASTIAVQTNFIESSKMIRLELRFYPDLKNTYLLFPDYEIGKYSFLKGILFSNGETVLDLEFKNFSNLNNYDIPNIKLNKNQIQTMLKIFKNPKKITMRIYTSNGYFDMAFDDNFKIGLIDLLEISLKG